MKKSTSSQVARLLITCQDKPGIIAAISGFLKTHGANITESDQHSTDAEGGKFFMRLEFQAADLTKILPTLRDSFRETVAKSFNLDWQLTLASEPKRMAIFVSKLDHVLLEILWRQSRHELAMTIPFIISNHPDLASAANHFNIPFHPIPVTKETKKSSEEKMLSLCEGKVDGIILARYMQVLTGDFIRHYTNKIINIHHSFLPAFVGANPYQQAYDKGVKLIGATAHYVTEDLDMGPIITQDVLKVSHRSNPTQLKALGQDIERNVLARAVKAHVEDRIIVDGNKTIVFDAY